MARQAERNGYLDRPDRVGIGESCDLRAHYDFVDRYLWSALALSYATLIVLQGLEPVVLGTMQFPNTFIHALLAFPIILTLAIWPVRKLHRIVVPLFFLWVCIRVLPARMLIV